MEVPVASGDEGLHGLTRTGRRYRMIGRMLDMLGRMLHVCVFVICMTDPNPDRARNTLWR